MKNLKLKAIAAAIATMLLGVSAAYAQKEIHNVGIMGKGPHGGTIQDAKTNLAEIMVKDNKVYIYILDSIAQSISNKGITGSAMLQFADGSTTSANLVAEGTEGFVLDYAKAATFSNCIVAAMVNGKSVTANFKNIPSAQRVAAAHADHSGHAPAAIQGHHH